jgi:hypothetical protein
MPRNGRSARAGAARRAGFFSARGNEALSSLAVAGGGVTVGTRSGNEGIGSTLKKRQSPGNHKIGKQDTDMREHAFSCKA